MLINGRTLILKIIVNISNSILGMSYITISMPFLFHYSFKNLENISALLKFKLFLVWNTANDGIMTMWKEVFAPTQNQQNQSDSVHSDANTESGL